MWGVLLIAFIVGLAIQSVGAFVAIMGVGVLVSLVLRFKVWR